MDPIVQFQGIKRHYKQNEVLKELFLDVNEEDFLVLFGLPGSGRSVLLRLLMGLEKPDGGNILLRGKEATEIEPGKRNIGYIPQSFALFPHMTVFENIAYPLKLAKTGKEKVKSEVERVAEQLGIGDLLSRMPDQTSGGQKQRVAIARGIVQDTDLFIFDDPLAGLDFKLREQLVDDLKLLQEKMHITIIYSTSDALEALSLADTIALLHNGVIIESGSPGEIYLNPKQADTMRLLGFPGANMFEVPIDKKNDSIMVNAGIFDIKLSQKTEALAGFEKILVGIRPESVLWVRPKEACFELEGKVLLCEDLGGEEIVYLGMGDKILTVMRFHFEEASELPYGTTVNVFVRENDIVFYNPGTFNRL